ncbi:MAG TPA: hypothetical protein VFM79_00320, partial [Pelobium sp.]|nr:hypothetical protein [Pelobium sp.]
KILRIELKLLDSVKLSPGSILRFGIIAYDKKKNYTTTGLNGYYPVDVNYRIEIINGQVHPRNHDIITVNTWESLKSNEVKIKATLLSNPSIFTEKFVKIDFTGDAHIDYTGEPGLNGTSGGSIFGPAGGVNALNNAKNGGNGTDVVAEAKILEYLGKKIVLVKAIPVQSGESKYYATLVGTGKIIINVSGGNGGHGGTGASGPNGDKDKYVNGGKGGDGGNGADGGHGANIKITYDPSIKGHENQIVMINQGGQAGMAGRAGSGGTGYKKGEDGRQGQSGRAGMAGRFPEISYATVELAIPVQ